MTTTTYLQISNDQVRVCKACNTLYRRGPHLFFNKKPKDFEDGNTSECPSCKSSRTEPALRTQETNFDYLFIEDHGLAPLDSDEFGWMDKPLSDTAGVK